MAAAGSARVLSPAVAAEVREALAHRCAAGQDFEAAWAAVLRGLTPSQRDDLWLNAWDWRQRTYAAEARASPRWSTCLPSASGASVLG
jgi:hypothetical protein